MLFLLAGLLALVGIPGRLGSATNLAAVAVCDLAVALLAVLFPWERTPRNAPAVLGLLGFAVLGFATWSFGGVASGTGPFLVLLYAWAAMQFPRWVLAGFVAPATVAYLLPLILTRQPPPVLGSAVVLVPVAVTIALLIEAQARHLREDRERLARVERWRSAMVSTLAHDIRSPLATVRFALDELRERATGHEERMIGAALRQTARVARLADGLLDVERIDSSGHLTLDRQIHEARRLAEDILLDVGSTGVRVEADENLQIFVDRQRFEQILVNLVGNAVRYGKPPVVVRITREGGTDRLEVRDHGPGVGEDLLPRLFGRFAVGGPEGVGLGLWIVRQLAEAHGGRALAEARDPGVAMVVTFPAARPAVPGSPGR